MPCFRFEVCAYLRVGFLYLLFEEINWSSLVAQMVKNPPAMQETWV